MATTTTNLGLKKPADEDFIDVQDLNDNMDKIDEALEDAKDELTTHTEDENNPHKTTAEQVGALPLTGGTLTGALLLANGYCKARGTSSTLQFESINVAGDSSNRTLLNINNSNYSELAKALTLNVVTSGSTKGYRIFGEHNKPSGSYMGNSSSTSRTISTGGLGNVLIVQNDTIIMIVSSGGAVLFHLTNKSVTYYDTTTIKYVGGTLTIASSDAKLNYSGTQYYYWSV